MAKSLKNATDYMDTLKSFSNKSTQKIKWNILLIYFLYIALIIAEFCSHENFSDEAQAWLIARDLSLGEIISQMKYEGHFLLWYLILLPWAKLGISFKIVNILSALFMIISAGLVLFKSPFSTLQKCIVLLTAPMLYAFPTIAIRYSLAPMLLSLIATSYKNKLDHPIRYGVLLILFGNVHVLLWGLLGALCIDFLIEIIKNKKLDTLHISSLIMTALGLILSLLPLLGSVSTNETLEKTASFRELIIKFGRMLIEHFKWVFLSENNFTLLILVVISAAAITIYGLIYHRKYTFIYLAGLLFQVAVLASLYHTVWQKSLFILVNLIFVLWIKGLEKTDDNNLPKGRLAYLWVVRIALFFLMVLSMADGVLSVRSDLQFVYSSGKETADYIMENTNDAVFVTMEETSTMAAVCGYLPKDSGYHFYQLRYDTEFSFVTWDENEVDVLDDTLIDRINSKFDLTQDIYYIHLGSEVYSDEYSNYMVEKYVSDGYLTQVFNSGESLSGEDFTIYKVNR